MSVICAIFRRRNHVYLCQIFYNIWFILVIPRMSVWCEVLSMALRISCNLKCSLAPCHRFAVPPPHPTPPIPIGPVDLNHVWHPMSHQEGANIWVGLLTEIASSSTKLMIEPPTICISPTQKCNQMLTSQKTILSKFDKPSDNWGEAPWKLS